MATQNSWNNQVLDNNVILQGGNLQLGNDAAAHTITIGNSTTTTSVAINSGTGDITLVTQDDFSLTATGDINIENDTAGAHTINIGTGVFSTTINIGTGNANYDVQIGSASFGSNTDIFCGSGGLVLGSNSVDHNTTIGSTTGGSRLRLQAGSAGIDANISTGDINLRAGTGGTIILRGPINIGADSTNDTLNFGTATSTGRTINIGTGSGTTALNLTSGSGALTLTAGNTSDLNLQATDEVLIDANNGVEINAAAGTIEIGNDANNQNINIGGAGVRTVTVGSNQGASNTVLQSGSGTVAINTTSGNATIVLTPHGTGTVNIAYGTNHAVTIYGPSGALSEVGPGSSGELLQGQTGSDPIFTATPTVTSLTVTNAPSASTDATNKTYVDAIAAGFVFQQGCVAATTANLTATYDNGTSGVGATLTNAGAQAAFSIDGESPGVNDRVLIKDQTNQFENGIYTVTTVGDGSTNWVLTRATDYDTSGEIAPGDLVAVTAGTVNDNSLWLETATVTTMGTDAIVFEAFNVPGNYVQTMVTDAGSATASSGSMTLTGGSNIGTSASGSTVTIDLDNTVSVSGSVTAGTGLVATTGGVTSTGASAFTGGTFAVGSDATDNAINIGTAANTGRTVTIGNTTGTSTVSLNSGTGGITLTAGGNANIILDATDNIELDADDILSINCSAGPISIGNDANTGAINIGTGAASRTLTIGNQTGTTAVNFDSGSGSFTFTSPSGGGEFNLFGDFRVNASDASSVIDIGNNPDSSAINIGTGAAQRVITIGNNTANTEINLDTGGTGVVAASGDVTVGTGLTVTTGNADILAGNISVGTASPANPARISVEESVAGSTGTSVQNTLVNVNAAAIAQYITEPGAGDPGINFVINGGQNWSLGIDNDNTDAFKITTGSSPSGGTTVLSVTTGLAMSMPATSVTMNGGQIDIGTGVADDAINIGTNSNVGRTVTIGDISGGSTLSLNSGTGGLSLNTAANADITLAPGGTGVTTTTKDIHTSGVSFDSGTNVLDTYTATTAWTPVVAFGGASVGITYATQTASFSQIGVLKWFRLDIELTNKGSSTGQLIITGIPVPSTLGVTIPLAIRYGNITYSGNELVGAINSGNIFISELTTASGVVNIDDTYITNTSQIFISGMYI